MTHPLVIGWKERLNFPEWGIHRIRAKIDTGARTSAVDAVDYEMIQAVTGTLSVRLRLALERRHPERVTVVETPVLRMVRVRNSGGTSEERPLIETVIGLGPLTKRIRLTVTRRPAMLHRLLLGREALAGDFLVDVSRKYRLS
jgi:hypothetical protein